VINELSIGLEIIVEVLSDKAKLVSIGPTGL
jgi:hypothetical protein